MSNNLQIIFDKREAILLAEIGAWLHMLSKFHEGFLSNPTNFDVTTLPSDLTNNYPTLCSLLCDSWPGPIWDSLGISQLDAIALSFEDIIKNHHNKNVAEGLLRLMWDAHGRASGIEKGPLNRFCPSQQDVRISSAIGYETDVIDQSNLGTQRNGLYCFLENKLQYIRHNNAQINWTQFRKDFIQELTQTFETSVAETRRPINDVTLLDQTVISVAFIKSALAQNLIEGWKDPVQNKYLWRILRIGLNGSAYWGQAVRLNDLLSRKAQVKPALDKVQFLLEKTCPIGNEVYRDENGSLFIVPDIDNLTDASINGQPLKEQLQKIAAKSFDGEAYFTITLGKPARNMLQFGRLATEELESLIPCPNQVKNWWKADCSKEICPVCGLRPQGPKQKALDRNVCDICEKRRSDRSMAWYDNLITTIWTNELSDVNGRLALITAQFDLESWLSGRMFSSILSFSPENRSLTDSGRNNKNYTFSYSDLINNISQAIPSRQTFGRWVPLLNDLMLSNARGGFNRFNDIYDLYVTDTDLPNPTKEDWRFALAIMRQQPSFARIRRIWETTRRFWKEVLSGIENIVPETSRLEIKGLPVCADGSGNFPGPYHTYELVLEQIRLSVVCNPADKHFITCDNLEYLKKPEQLGEDVRGWLDRHRGHSLNLEEPAGYGSRNKVWGKVTITEVSERSETFTPVIPILTEPRTFMALIPADKALDVANAIRIKYEREMGKVRNRLPLHLGVIYFHRRTALRAAIDAGRRISNTQTDMDKTWCVKDTPEKKEINAGELPDSDGNIAQGTNQFDEWYPVEIEQNGESITWKVPALMGDGQTEDNWYPYVFVETHGDDSKVNTRGRCFKGLRPTPNGTEACWLVHAGDLKAGDEIYFSPSTFDFEFLDTTARRFEIAYNEQGKRRSRVARPYLLDDLTMLNNVWESISNKEKGLTSNQIYALRDLIQAKRDEWQPSENDCERDGMFWKFCRDAFATAQWSQTGKPDKAKLDELADRAVSGVFADVLELRMSIMKEKPERDSEEESDEQ